MDRAELELLDTLSDVATARSWTPFSR